MSMPPPSSSSSVSPSATGVLTIDLAALADNYARLKTQAGPTCAVAGVVKADAYGLGMTAVQKTLAADCPFYFTAVPDEALALRRLTDKPVAVLCGLLPGTADLYLRHNLTPVLNSLEDVERWQDAAARHARTLPAILHFDTGMNRLGLPPDETAQLLDHPEQLEGLYVTWIMSHFACADDAPHPLTQKQHKLFSTIAQHYPQAQKSLANSSGLFRDRAYLYDMVRPGMALYGLNPTPESVNPMASVVRLDVRLLQVKTVKAGHTVGYSATYRCDGPTRVGTVALGYADGFLRSLSNKGVLYYKGRPCPIIGRVSMDLVTIDLGDYPALPGDMIEVIGPHQSADTLAARAGTIGYEILTSLGHRYQRIYQS